MEQKKVIRQADRNVLREEKWEKGEQETKEKVGSGSYPKAKGPALLSSEPRGKDELRNKVNLNSLFSQERGHTEDFHTYQQA